MGYEKRCKVSDKISYNQIFRCFFSERISSVGGILMFYRYKVVVLFAALCKDILAANEVGRSYGTVLVG